MKKGKVQSDWHKVLKKFVQISCKFRMNLTGFSHVVHRDRRFLRKTLPISTGFPPHTMGRGNGARPKQPFHLVADRKHYKTSSTSLAGSVQHRTLSSTFPTPGK